MAVRKKRTYITKAEFYALDYFLSIAQSDYSEAGDKPETVEEIERLRAKLRQMQLQQKKV
jgi:hypothetical protein